MDSTRDHRDGTTAAPSARALVDSIGTQTAITRTAAAARFDLIDQLRLVTEAETGASWTDPDNLAWRDLRAEIAAVLTIHERSAEAHLDLARRLVHDFPATLSGLRDAAFPESHARILVDESTGLSPEMLPVYEERLLPSASELIAPRFAKLAREVRAALQPEALIERHQEALTTRRTALEAAPDGMAWYGALLDGYGPIDADTARQLCAGAPGFIRVLTDPEDGSITSFGRTTYRVPTELKRLLRVRDEVCRFVGCTRSATLCDIDHTIPWQEDGETVEANLAHLCRGHHRIKERRRWKVGHDPGGIIRWTSPTGRTYETKPARRGFPPRVGAPPKPMVEWLLRDTATLPADGTAPF